MVGLAEEIEGYIVAAYKLVSSFTDVGKSAAPFVNDYLAFLRGIISGTSYKLPVAAKLLAVADKKRGAGLLKKTIAASEKLLIAEGVADEKRQTALLSLIALL